MMPLHVQDHLVQSHADSSFENQKFHVLSDFISGMTDRYAISMWRKIFDPTTLKF